MIEKGGLQAMLSDAKREFKNRAEREMFALEQLTADDLTT